MNQYCYFHKSQPIEHFCSLKQCTLPLCKQCLDIHQQEHADRHSQPSIISYHQAYQQVLDTLTQFVQSAQSSKSSILDKINRDKTQAVKAIQQYYTQYLDLVQTESSSLQQIEQKLHKLQKGSIKTVIYFYSGDISLKQPSFQNFKTISLEVQKLIQNIKHPLKQPLQTFTQQLSIHQSKELQQPKNTSFQSKQKSNSKKKLIFSNEKYQHTQHKNTNYPYLENLKKDQSFKLHPRQNIESQVKNYFNHQNFSKENSINRQQYEPNHNFFIQETENSKALKETPIVLNVDYKGTRSKTLDKFPSMAELKIASKENLYQPLVRNEEQRRLQSINIDYKPGKWNKERVTGQINHNKNNEAPNSIYSQFKVTESIGQNEVFLQQEFPNRQPLKTTDLDIYTPINPNPVMQGRQRAFSYEPGLRTTMSHNNLQIGKRNQSILGDELKKNVLSPQEIRKMLQKKIEQRNKILVQKKQYQLKINTDRSITKNNTTINLRGDNLSQMGQKNQFIPKERQSISPLSGKEKNLQPIMTRQLPSEQRSGLYNTRDSIINQIYRQTRY